MAPWFSLSPLSFSLFLLPLERRADRKCKLPPISVEFYKDTRQTISQVTPRRGPLLAEIRQIWWGRGMALGREMKGCDWSNWATTASGVSSLESGVEIWICFWNVQWQEDGDSEWGIVVLVWWGVGVGRMSECSNGFGMLICSKEWPRAWLFVGIKNLQGLVIIMWYRIKMSAHSVRAVMCMYVWKYMKIVRSGLAPEMNSYGKIEWG